MREMRHCVSFARIVFLRRMAMCAMVLGATCFARAQAAELRDPFTFGPRTQAHEQTSPILIGILWDATHPLAMIGEETVGVGDSVDGWSVVQIQQSGLIIQREERREFIGIGNPLPSD